MKDKKKSVSIKASQKSVGPAKDSSPSSEESTIRSSSPPHQRIQTAEGWKREMLRKRKQEGKK